MGIIQNNSEENKHNFQTNQIEKKAGSQIIKANLTFWGVVKSPLSILAGIFSFIIGKTPGPFDYVIDTLFKVYFQNITEEQSKILVKSLNDEFDKIFDAIKINLEKLIDMIIEKDGIEKETHYQFERKMGEFKQASDNSKDINILLIGKTGVGKSTLINALLELSGENMAPESLGKIGTLNFITYSSEHWKHINLIDSRGFDFSKPIESYQKDTNNYLRENNNSKLNFIDIIFYCFRGDRFEDEEKKLILSLKEAYSGNDLPIIFVYTHNVTSNFEYMKEYVKKELNDNNLIIINVLAKDEKLINDNIIKAFGIKELKAETTKKISDIKNKAFCKKFYKGCLTILYNPKKIDSFVLNNIIGKLIQHNRKKYTFEKCGQFDKEKDKYIINEIRKISDIFVDKFNDSLGRLSELVIEYQAESKIRGKRENKRNEMELNPSEKNEKYKIVDSCNLSELQDEIKKLILSEYANCLDKLIDEMFEKKLNQIFDYYINLMSPMMNY